MPYGSAEVITRREERPKIQVNTRAVKQGQRAGYTADGLLMMDSSEEDCVSKRLKEQ